MQKSFSDLEYAAKKKLTRRDRFLAKIDEVTPWSQLHQQIEPFYPKAEGAGRPPVGLARMLRMYVAQQCFGLSDEGMEDAIYDSQAIRGFVGIDLNRESAPDATTLLKFRRLLENNELTRKIFETINGHLAAKGLMMREGTIVDATLIAASPSTKNKDKKRDPEMHQSKKGNDWHFGLKAHIGVDAASGLVHTVIGTAGNVSDVTQAHALLHGDEIAALGDAGYQGVEKRAENLGKAVTWHVAMKRSKRKALPTNKLGRAMEKLEHLKASVRAKVEHPFHVVKNLFHHRKARYRGLEKNTAQLFTLFDFANLVLAGRQFKVTESRTPS
jgi:IS5 family transposase